MNQWFHNGVQAENVSIDDRAFQYGDGLFETVAIRRGVPRLWDYHISRLTKGCDRLRINMPDALELREWLEDAVAQSAQVSAYCAAKIIISSGVTHRGYAREQPTKAETFVGVFSSMPIAISAYRDGVRTSLCETRLATNSVTAGLKTLNRLEQVLARSECVADGAFEGLTLDAEGRLICGTMSNVFIVANDSIVTPSLERCGVEGVMRRHTIESLRSNNTVVEIRDVGAAELWDSDEAFLTNSQFGALPIRRCKDKTWQSHAKTRDVMAMLADSGIAECAV